MEVLYLKSRVEVQGERKSGNLRDMDNKHLLEKVEIDADDWEKTPVSVRKLVVKLDLKIEQLEQHLKELQVDNQQQARESESKFTELP